MIQMLKISIWLLSVIAGSIGVFGLYWFEVAFMQAIMLLTLAAVLWYAQARCF